MTAILSRWLILPCFLGFVAGCGQSPKTPAAREASASTAKLDVSATATPEAEVETRYAGAHPEIQEYILWTAKNFGPGGLWLPENAFANLPPEAREKRILYLVALFKDAEYGRHLCSALAEAGAFKDARMVPGLMKIAGYHRDGEDYDCRPKWMAAAALARQESAESVPLLISLVDHGNQNTRNWARAALARQTGQDFKQDKQAWARCWVALGHEPVAEQFLKPYVAPVTSR